MKVSVVLPFFTLIALCESESRIPSLSQIDARERLLCFLDLSKGRTTLVGNSGGAEGMGS